jgi:primosomal protein N' (replication factor Y)
VPLGTRRVTGVVVDPAAVAPSDADLRDVIEVLDDEPFLPADIVDLALWVGEYYACGPGDALTVAMPPSARQGQPTSFRTITMAEVVVGAGPPPKGAKQRDLLARLAEHPGGLSLPALGAQGIGADVVRRTAALGLVRLRDEVIERDPFTAGADGEGGHWAIETAETSKRPLTSEQAEAFEKLVEAADARAFKTVLLHGVTGSGKTEIYVRLARHVLAQGRRVLVLVPEIALTPALAGVFRAAFGNRVAIQRSVRRRATRPVASHPPRRRRTCRGHEVRGVRAHSGTRSHHRRRRARVVIQAG